MTSIEKPLLSPGAVFLLGDSVGAWLPPHHCDGRGRLHPDFLLRGTSPLGTNHLINRQQSEPRKLTPVEREAQKVFAKREAEKALSQYEAAQRSLHANRERLKAERLAREAVSSKLVPASRIGSACI